jgi:shikimate dehydrogenase
VKASAKSGPAAPSQIWAAVVGHPVSHSISPEIFRFLSRRLKKDLCYGRLDIAPEDFSAVVRSFKKSDFFLGWNVTIPHKETIAAAVDWLSPEARAIGAVNVVHFSKGRLRGHNTDAFGIAQTLRENQVEVRGRTVVLFGAGGAARAMGYVLGSFGARQVFIANRSMARGRVLCHALTKAFRKTEFKAVSLTAVPDDAALYVNSTPLGMKGFTRQSLLPSRVKTPAVAFDLIYRPENTVFLQSARKQGLRTVGGLDMLLWQALRTWEIWLGPIPRRRYVKTALAKHLREVIL